MKDLLVIVFLPQLDEGVHAGQDRHGALLAQQGPDVPGVVQPHHRLSENPRLVDWAQLLL